MNVIRDFFKISRVPWSICIVGPHTSIADLQAEGQAQKSTVSDGTQAKNIDERLEDAKLAGNQEFMEEARKELMGDEARTKDTKMSAEEEEAKKAADLEEEGRKIASQWISDTSTAVVRLLYVNKKTAIMSHQANEDPFLTSCGSYKPSKFSLLRQQLAKSQIVVALASVRA